MLVTLAMLTLRRPSADFYHYFFDFPVSFQRGHGHVPSCMEIGGPPERKLNEFGKMWVAAASLTPSPPLPLRKPRSSRAGNAIDGLGFKKAPEHMLLPTLDDLELNNNDVSRCSLKDKRDGRFKIVSWGMFTWNFCRAGWHGRTREDCTVVYTVVN